VTLHLPSSIRPSLRLLAALLAAPMLLLQAQDSAPVVQPPLASFAAMRVAVVPAQLWHADTSGWSHDAQWSVLRPQLDSAISQTLRDGGLGAKWAYAGDVVRSARRNPLYSKDPATIGVGRWRNELPKPGDALAALVADNLRSISALGDTRHALIPVELRGDGEMARLRMVLVDTRSRTVVWAADLRAPAGPDMLSTLAQHLAALIIEP
jgi:hypothetical protein